MSLGHISLLYYIYCIHTHTRTHAHKDLEGISTGISISTQTQKVPNQLHCVVPFLYSLFPSLTLRRVCPIQKSGSPRDSFLLLMAHTQLVIKPCKNGRLHLFLSFLLPLQLVRTSRFPISFTTLGPYNSILGESISVLFKRAKHASPLG